jgi:hypothetical protein
MLQRIRLKPKGGTIPASARPTIMLPDHDSMAATSRR